MHAQVMIKDNETGKVLQDCGSLVYYNLARAIRCETNAHADELQAYWDEGLSAEIVLVNITIKVTNRNGTIIDYDAAVNAMDDDLREQVHMRQAPCTEQEFFAAYETAYEVKYGEEWELSKKNPVW